jgi:2-polyprenyl-3-methyl-5-hydroxy-6-metoxy-1,4-benzoquinol methylase
MSEKKNQCRFCDAPLARSVADLGMSPLANSYVKHDQLHAMEAFFPLHAYVCESCLLVQLEEFESAENIFSDYSYFSSYSESWLKHAKNYTESMTARFGIDKSWQVMEIASNDGYLLQYFKEQGVPVLGIEPAENVAKVAQEAGIESIVKFFGVKTANELVAENRKADLLLGNNVLAHVPDLNDFVAGEKIVLNKGGIITMEFPHLLRLIEENQFDTIYHEHFSYFSFLTVEKVFASHGLVLFDVEEIPTHGGSLRIYGRHDDDDSKPVEARVEALKEKERKAGLADMEVYDNYAEKVKETKRKLLEFLISAKREGKSVVGYGAAAKGNTLLNYCGIRNDFLDYVVDLSPHKQDHYLPGTRVPIFAPDKIKETRPDYVLILPWNLSKEISSQMAYIKEWGGKFVVPIPEVHVYE